jgi:hypothetical protein
MAMKLFAIGVVGACGLGATLAVGQVIYNSASTAGEGYARGLGAVIDSQGQKNLNDSQAAINLTDARSNQIDNQVKSVNAFWEKKDIYAERQQQEFAKIEQKRSVYIANLGNMELTPQEFDRTSGRVTWPKVLEQSQYNPYRSVLDKMFQQRAYQGALTGDEYMEATAASKQWRDMLSGQKKVYPAPILKQMIRFILKCDRELNDNLG